MAKRNPIEAALIAILEEHDLAFTVHHTSKHPSLRFEVGGRKLQYFFPGTPTCPRSLANNVATLRRLIRRAKNESVCAASA